ncbi:MAG TPA: hypothetical protein VK453_03730 [Micromonosporaceae bacterium]|nr:hypothetical protein [Micromonosporaceae bacterium]
MSFQPAVVPPGLSRLRRRLATYHDFLDELVRDVEQSPVDGVPLGRRWDVAGDPRAMKLAALWAYVAEGVAAYTELTAGEAYLPTAQDWTDLRRLAGLVGYRPQQRVAAQGWVMVDTDRGAGPVVPAGTRVQAPGTSTRPAQVFEVAEETQLYADRAGLTATPVPVPAAPAGPTLRFLQDPGFRVGDRVLFVEELAPTGAGAPPPWSYDWSVWWTWLLWWWYLYQAAMSANATPLAVAKVTGRVADLGTVVVTFDRDLGPLLSDPSRVYAAYRVVTAAGSARRQASTVRIPTSGTPSTTTDKIQLAGFYTGPAGLESSAVVLDTQLDELSPGQRVAVVDWGLGRGATIETADLPACDVVEPTVHSRLDWEVAPGSTVPASRLQFGGQLAALARATLSGRPVRVYVVGARIPAQHYELPTAVTGTPARLRLYPAPGAAHPVERIALRNPAGTWDVFDCAPAPASAQELPPPGHSSEAPRGLLVDLIGATLPLPADRAPANANLVRVRHGTTTVNTLGSGDASRPGQRFAVPKAPVAADLGPDGTPVSTLEVRVAGLLWPQRPTLYATGTTDAYTTALSPDGAQAVVTGDGVEGNRVPTGRNNVVATYRVGGGTVGELPAGAITALLGSVRGVKSVVGAGPTSGGADQDDPRRIRRLAPGRSRVGDRVVSRADLADVARGFPGVSHAAAWRGAGPAGCPCGGTGEHVAFLRLGTTGPRPPTGAEVDALAAYLDGRRDLSVPLCVSAGTVTALPLTAQIVPDPRARPADVTAAVVALLTTAGGPLDPLDRALGVALDRSDVMVHVHAVAGVVGVPVLTLGAADPPARFELVGLAPAPAVTAVTT